MSETAILLLAAGESSRMGSPKQLLPIGDIPLVRHAAEQALAAGCGPVTVVLGANAPQVREALDGLNLELIYNSDWQSGIGSSIRSGVSAIEGLPVSSLILALADQPLLTPAIYRNFANTFQQTGKPIVAATYAETVGVPVLFDRSVFPALLDFAPDQGCKGLILRRQTEAIFLACPEAITDIDTPADYAQFARKSGETLPEMLKL